LKHGKIVSLLLIILITSGVGAAVYLDPSLLNRLTGQTNTVLSVSQINVDPQGSVVNDKYVGSFWNILVYVNANDDIAGVVLPKNQTGSITYQGAVKALQTGAKVEVKIDPGTPYLIRDIQEKQVMYAPGATGGSSTTNPVYMRYYDWGEATWRIYTPFTVSIYKDGSLVGQQTLNMAGSASVQTVDTNIGKSVRIENLGLLSGSYTGFSSPSQIAILKGYANVYDWTQIQSAVNGGTASNTYATYWFGSQRNSNNQATNPTVAIGTSYGNVYAPSKYGGWSGSDYGAKATPVAPVIGQQDKSSLPSDERSFYSLTEFIEQRMGVNNLASSLFNTQSTGSVGALWQKASFVTDTNGQTALRLDIPWSAFGTPLVNIRIPTELADTFIERPVVTSTSISASWISTGSTTADLYGSSRIAVTVTNTGTVTGSTKLAISSGNSKLSVTPLEMTVNNLEPNVPQIVYFDATNLGVENEVSSIPVTITASDTYTGSQTGIFTLYGTLKATLTTGTSQLILHVVEKGSTKPVVGLQFTVQYGNQAPTVYPDAKGTITLTLANPQGGAYVGDVVVTSADTTVYKTATASYNFDSAKIMEKTFEVERKDTAYPKPDTFDWTLVAIIALVIALAAAIGVGVYFKSHKGSRRRR
jgi:hypothetical protein